MKYAKKMIVVPFTESTLSTNPNETVAKTSQELSKILFKEPHDPQSKIMQYTSQLARLKESYKPEISTNSYLEEIKTLLENAIQTNTLTRTEVKTEPIKTEPPKTEPIITEPIETETNISEDTPDAIKNDDQTQLGPLKLDESMDDQEIDVPTLDNKLLKVTIANELLKIGIINKKSPDILKIEQELNYKSEPNRKFLVNDENTDLVRFGFETMVIKHNEWISNLTSTFSSSPTNNELEKLRVLEENLKLTAKHFFGRFEKFFIAQRPAVEKYYRDTYKYTKFKTNQKQLGKGLVKWESKCFF
jgi:hypothetical protein